MISAVRYHDFCAGHRVVNHESKCRHLHGHNYRVTFHCRPADGALDDLGRVLDFSAIKELLCEWLEDHWDHRLLLWVEDPLLPVLQEQDPTVVVVPFNPTAENLAHHLRTEVAPKQLAGTGITCHRVEVQETRKCSATSEENQCE